MSRGIPVLIRVVFRMRVLVSATLVMVTGSALVGCADAEADTAKPTALAVVTTTTQVSDFVRQVVANSSITQLIKPDQSAHAFDPSAKQLVALSRADVLVINGAGLEPWLKDAIAAAEFKGKVIDCSAGIELEEKNPHIWTDPKLAMKMVSNIASGFESVRNADVKAIAKSAGSYIASLQSLDAWTRQSIDQVAPAQRLLVTNHDAFIYFITEYQLTFVGSVMPSFEDNAEPSAAQIDELIAKIRQTGVKAVFSETTLSPKTAATVAREAGVKVYSGPDSLYSDSLGFADSDGATYISSQIHNVQRIMESWGVDALPVPAELSAASSAVSAATVVGAAR